jgi:transcriptional regulator GlxA family with amidase domain
MERLITSFREENNAVSASHWAAVVLDEISRLDRLDSFNRDVPGAEKIRAIIVSIRADPARPRSVAEMADSCGWTPGHFTRVFSRLTGTNPRDFLIDSRISAAQEILRMSNESSAKIAARLGFVDVYHFGKRFRQKTGISPGRFRRGETFHPKNPG